MSLSRDFCEKVLAVRFADLPESARHAAKLSLADGLVTMLGALTLEPATAPFRAHALGSPGTASLLGGGLSTPGLAALANGALSHALDFEDTFDAAGLHPNAVIIPVLLALAETGEAVSGPAFLSALAAGTDAACRMGLALAADPAARGWYHPPMIAAAAAALSGAHLLRLDADRAVAALSLTLCQFQLTDQLKRSPRSDLRAVRDGFAARAAVEACLLARLGVSGTDAPLEGKGGLFDLLTGAPPQSFLHEVRDGRFLGAEITLKIWPCCRGTHGAMALALGLRAEGITGEAIAAVTFDVAPPDDMLLAPLADRQRPATMTAAKFSIPFCFAHALVHGAVGLESFNAAARADPAVLALAGRMRPGVLLDAGAASAAHVVLAEGKERHIPLPPPPVLNAGTTAFSTMQAKFSGCLDAAGAPALAGALPDICAKLEAERDLVRLLRLLRFEV